jgi:hypothetical protein
MFSGLSSWCPICYECFPACSSVVQMVDRHNIKQNIKVTDEKASSRPRTPSSVNACRSCDHRRETRATGSCSRGLQARPAGPCRSCSRRSRGGEAGSHRRPPRSPPPRPLAPPSWPTSMSGSATHSTSAAKGPGLSWDKGLVMDCVSDSQVDRHDQRRRRTDRVQVPRERYHVVRRHRLLGRTRRQSSRWSRHSSPD